MTENILLESECSERPDKNDLPFIRIHEIPNSNRFIYSFLQVENSQPNLPPMPKPSCPKQRFFSVIERAELFVYVAKSFHDCGVKKRQSLELVGILSFSCR